MIPGVRALFIYLFIHLKTFFAAQNDFIDWQDHLNSELQDVEKAA
jgi:hypothetical protein